MNRIRYLRLQKNMKQSELAQIIHVSQSSLSGYENEKFEPDKKTLQKLAEFFGVSVDYLLGFDGTSRKPLGSFRTLPVCGNYGNDGRQMKNDNIVIFADSSLFCAPNAELFSMEIPDDCMEPNICRGDIVIVKKQPNINNGDTVIVRIAGNNTVVKKIFTHKAGIALISNNQQYKPLFYTHREIDSLPVEILGKAVELHRKL